MNILISYKYKDVSFVTEDGELKDFDELRSEVEDMFESKLSDEILSKLLADTIIELRVLGNEFMLGKYSSVNLAKLYEVLELLISKGEEDFLTGLYYTMGVKYLDWNDIDQSLIDTGVRSFFGEFWNVKEAAKEVLIVEEGYSVKAAQHTVALSEYIADTILEDAGIVGTEYDYYFYN